MPPAASIFARADAVNASATTNSGVDSSPLPRILSGLFRLRTRPTARRMSWLTVIWAARLGLALGLRVGRLGLERAALDGRLDGADVHDLVLDLEAVLEAAQLRDAHVERRLAALEPRRDRAAGAGLLALGAAARGLALAGGDAAADPGALLARPFGAGAGRGASCGFSFVVLGAAGRARPWRLALRAPSPRRSPRRSRGSGPGGPCRASPALSATTLVLPMPCRPRALTVARLRAMWLIVLLVWVTFSLPAIGHLRGRGRLAGDAAGQLDPAASAQLLGRVQAAQRLDRRAGHVDRVGRAVDLGQDVADAGRLEDGADRAAGDDAGALARRASAGRCWRRTRRAPRAGSSCRPSGS